LACGAAKCGPCVARVTGLSRRQPAGVLGLLQSPPGGARPGGQLEELSTGARRCWRWGTAGPKAIHTLVVWMGRLSTAARSATTGTLQVLNYRQYRGKSHTRR